MLLGTPAGRQFSSSDDKKTEESALPKFKQFKRRPKLTKEEMAEELLAGDFLDPETERDYPDPAVKEGDKLYTAEEVKERLEEIKRSGVREYEIMDI